ncbi:MAG: alpha/beta hydrolase, partial [Bacilli bacterium]|nr:alpha/beta hydrolase [Bacilli bacterium]
MLYVIIPIILLVICFICWYIFYALVFKTNKYLHNPDIYDFPHGPGFDKYGEDRMKSMVDEMNSYHYEDVYIKSFDGINLHAKYYHIKDGAPISICCHGYKGIAVRDFSGAGPMIIKSNQNVLLIDQRGHGKSKGKTITFGIKESQDVICWSNYLINRFGKDCVLFLYGVSMGASTALLASLRDDLPHNVKKVLVDCPFSSCRKILLDFAKKSHIPSWVCYFLAAPSALIFGHFNFFKGDILKEIKNIHLPTLIIHGTDDTVVPCYMSEKIASLNKNFIQLEIFPNADHAMSFLEDYD